MHLNGGGRVILAQVFSLALSPLFSVIAEQGCGVLVGLDLVSHVALVEIRAGFRLQGRDHRLMGVVELHLDRGTGALGHRHQFVSAIV